MSDRETAEKIVRRYLRGEFDVFNGEGVKQCIGTASNFTAAIAAALAAEREACAKVADERAAWCDKNNSQHDPISPQAVCIGIAAAIRARESQP